MTFDPSFWILLLAAPFVGSFLGVVALRWADGRPILWGRSECDACHGRLRPIDLIPFLSWFLLKRRCRNCGARLSTFYPFVELLAVVPVVWGATVLSGWLLAAGALYGWLLLALALVDWRTQRLPDVFTYPLALLGLGVAYLFDEEHWLDHLFGAAGGFAAFALLGVAYRKLRGRDGLGLGDAKLLAGIGAWISWEGVPTAVFLAAFAGLAVLLVRALAGRATSFTERIPFGPFLALGGWLVWLYGPLVPA